MGKIAAAKANISINSVAMEDEADDISLSVKQEVIKVDGFSQAGPEKVVGNYDWNVDLGGNADFAASQGDATMFALLGSAGVAMDLDPTGTAAGSSNPHYTGTVVLEELSYKFGVGGAAKSTYKLQGASALTRATS